MNDTASEPQRDARAVGGARLVIGLIQGLWLYLLYSAGDDRTWPATNAALFVSLVLIGLFVPLMVTQAVSTMRLRTLAIWTVVATALLVLLSWHDRSRIWIPDLGTISGKTGIEPQNVPTFGLFFFTAVGLFITHALISGGDHDRKWIARYDTYFDVAWKLGVQHALSACFVGAFWLLLWLGASLFNLIKLDFLEKLIEHAWFAIPATALAVAMALHLTDVRAKLVAGIRSVALILLAWLLPLMTLFAAGFLFSLIFTGLDPLWKTRSAAALLLVSAAALIVLINAAYQNGEDKPPFLLRWGASLASLTLVPIVALAAYAVMLRVRQYGWTEDRIASIACIVVAACYALGYAAAAIFSLMGRTTWLRGVERCNIATAFVVLAVLFAVFTPIADPGRIAVSSQVARLNSGSVSAEKFDYHWLRFRTGRYGHDALVELARSGNADVKRLAASALSTRTQYDEFNRPAAPSDLAGQITVYPKDHLLPQSLLHQDWNKTKSNSWEVPDCLAHKGQRCEAFFAELNGDTRDEIIFVSGADFAWTGTVMTQSTDGNWDVAGTLSLPHCKAALAALRAGQYAVVAPTPPAWRALEAGNTRFDIVPASKTPPSCPD